MRFKFVAVPIETAPLIYAHLRARKSKDPAIAREEYLKVLRGVNENYFAACRDADPDYQQLYTDFLCMKPLVERLSAILALSQMGQPKERPQMLLDCLGDLEGLICHLQMSYFPNGYTPSNKAVLNLETGAPFGQLYSSLTFKRPSGKERNIKLADENSSKEQKEYAIRLCKALADVTARRTTDRGKEKREFAKKLYMDLLATYLSNEEKETAKEFSIKTTRLEAYLQPNAANADTKVKEAIFTNIYRFAHQFLMDDIYTGEINNQAFALDPLPPEALFLEKASSEATLKIMKTVIPYISLNNALQGILQMSEYLRKSQLPLQTVTQATTVLIKGTDKIITAATSRLSRMLTIAGFESSLVNPFGFISQDPMRAAMELKSLFLGYQQDCYLFKLYSGCADCLLNYNCPYQKYADLDMEMINDITASLATTSDTAILCRVSGLALLYSIETSILVCRVADYEARQLLQIWQSHQYLNKELHSRLGGNAFTEHILKLVQGIKI